MADILVEVRDAAGKKVLDRQRTNPAGMVNFLVPHEGDYEVRVYDDERATAEPRTRAASRCTPSTAGHTNIPRPLAPLERGHHELVDQPARNPHRTRPGATTQPSR